MKAHIISYYDYIVDKANEIDKYKDFMIQKANGAFEDKSFENYIINEANNLATEFNKIVHKLESVAELMNDHHIYEVHGGSMSERLHKVREEIRQKKLKKIING